MTESILIGLCLITITLINEAINKQIQTNKYEKSRAKFAGTERRAI